MISAAKSFAGLIVLTTTVIFFVVVFIPIVLALEATEAGVEFFDVESD